MDGDLLGHELNRAALASEAIGEAAALRRLRALLPAEALVGAVVLLSVAALGQAPTPDAGALPGGSSFASPAPQLSEQALQGGALALAAAAVVAGVAIAAPAWTRSRPPG